MPAGERREYAGNAPPTSLSAGIDNATLTIPVNNATGYPTGVTGPFFIVVDRGLTTEEKIKCASRTGNTITAISGGRGVDGTSPSSHTSGAVVEHVFTADDANLTNQHYADITLDHHTQYLNNARHDVTARHGTAVLDMAALTLTLIPPGVMWDYGGATAPAGGWLLCDGSAVSRTTFANLFAAIGTAFGAGDGSTTFNLPDFRSRASSGSSAQNAVGAGVVANVALGAGLTGRARAVSTGAESQSITLANTNMPAHSHTANAHSHGFSTGTESNFHTHGLGGHVHNHDHNHTVSGDGLVYLITTGAGPYNINGSGPNWVTGDVAHTGHTSTNGGNTGGPSGGSDNNSPLHTHSGTTGNGSDTGMSTVGSGTAFTVNTIDPILVVTKIIKT